MPILSYFATARPGYESAFILDLKSLPWVEVVPATTHDVAVVITEPPDASGVVVFEQAAQALESLGSLTLVYGELTPSAAHESAGEQRHV